MGLNMPGALFTSTNASTVPTASIDVPAIQILQGADDGTIMLSFQTNAHGSTAGLDAGEPAERRWNIGVASPVQFGGSGDRPDRPFFLGYNFGVDGGGTGTPQESTSDCCFGLMIEPYYNLTGTSRHIEAYFSALPAGGDPATDQVRPFFVTAQWPTLASDTAVECGAEFNLESTLGFSFNMTYDNAGTLSTRTSDTAGTVTVTAAHNIVTATTKNVRWVVSGVGGARTGITIGAVSATTAGSTVAFSGGSGDNLPAQTSAIEFFDEDSIVINAGTTNDGIDTAMRFSAGAGMVAENNSRWIKQKNSTGTPRDLMYWRSDNFLVVGDFGAQKIYAAGYVQTFGVALGYTTTDPVDDTAFKAISGTSETPDNGAACVSFAATISKLWVRTNGTWKSVVCA